MKAVAVKSAKTNRTGSAPSRKSSNGSGEGLHPPPPVGLLEGWKDSRGLPNVQGSGTRFCISA